MLISQLHFSRQRKDNMEYWNVGCSGMWQTSRKLTTTSCTVDHGHDVDDDSDDDYRQNTSQIYDTLQILYVLLES